MMNPQDLGSSWVKSGRKILSCYSTISPRRDALFAAVIFIFAICGAVSAGIFTMHCCIYGVR